MEDVTFEYDDDYESSIDPNFFNMSNPTLDDLPMNNNNNGPTSLSQQNQNSNLRNPNPTNLSINNNNGPHEIHPQLGVLHRVQHSNFNDQFSTPLSQQNNHGLGILLQGHGSNSGTFNSNAMPQQVQSRGNIDPFNYNVISPENHHDTPQVQSGIDPFNYNIISPENDHGNNDLFSNAMSQQSSHGIQHGHGGNNETFSHAMVQNQNNQQNNNISSRGNNFEVGNSSTVHENQQQTEVLPIVQWPPPPQQFSCSCCQVLREFIHANGIQFEKLEIHGKLGFISHAIHHQTPVDGGPPICQMIDFNGKGLGEIRSFLAQYCMERNLAGYFLMQDPLYAYYETLCTGYDWIDDINMEGPNDNNSDEIMEQEQEQEQEQEHEQVGENGTPGRRNLSEQRKKAARFTLSDLCDYFHVPIDIASHRVNLATSTIKKICRKAELTRWPHRKVKSLLKQIAILQNQLDRQDPATRARTLEEISRLKSDMIDCCGGHAPTALNNVADFLPRHHRQQQ